MRAVLVSLSAVLLTTSGCVRMLAGLGLDRRVSPREKAQLQIEQFRGATLKFYTDIGRYPSEKEGLDVLIQRPADEASAKVWDGPYLDAEAIPADPWGNPYVYRAREDDETEPFEIISFGRDGKKGGTGADADISSTSLE